MFNRLLWLPVLVFLLCAEAYAAPGNTYLIYVAPKDSPAYTAAQAKADDQLVFAERKLHRALNRAAELLATGSHTVNILVAAGAYTGKAKQGTWVIPAIANPEGTLRIIGGFNDDFTGRQPFGNLTALVTTRGRNGAFLQCTKRSQLAELVISGFLFDAAPSNAYDSKTNSILKGQSRTYPMLSFAQLKVGHLVVADNIFINGAHGAFDPYISPTSPGIVDITNNFFINTIKTLKPAATKPAREINLRHNSFILNWPYNPDATSSNVSAIELYHSGGAAQVNIEHNLFAYNPGGAMQHDWPEDRMPPMAIRNNLFYMNAGLFADGEPEAGVIAGKFGHNPTYLLLDLETLEDDFDYDVSGNVSMDPQVPVALLDLQAADSYSVNRKNTVLNDVRQLFGLNQDGGTVAIANYAPAMVFNPQAIPLPMNDAAKGYGVQPTQLWNPR